jgi:hypothetical protein
MGNDFGGLCRGFTDEPQIMPAGKMPWANDMPQIFEKKWGYSLIDNLPSLVRQTGDWKKVSITTILPC